MTEWYFQAKDGSRKGPVNEEEFRQRRAAGDLDEDTLIWRSGFEAWTPLREVLAHESTTSDPPRRLR